ncbi:MAG: alpha-glucan family phosphorylase [Cyclobacteriaceae bacterium]|nr:alpha-glucan family phosphorylase [Cyclobacteriaceae bacterium]
MFDLKSLFPYAFNKRYEKPVAYFSMEFGIDQALKIYSGGLGFLAGSHLRSAFELQQNFVGIGILWKYGYYDQERNMDGTMKASYIEKNYSFLTDTGIVFPITIHNHTVQVKAWLLRPEVFQTAPLFLLSTDLPQNDHLAQTISHRLYDPHESARIAQSILLGSGGAKLLDIIGRETEIYHLNEGHGLPACFYLWNKYNDLAEVRKRMVFTTHTPEEAGNESHGLHTLEVMSFFDNVPREQYMQLVEEGETSLNYTLAALRMSQRANGVSVMHGAVSREMWDGFGDICEITEITNAQNRKFWMDESLERALALNDNSTLASRKRAMKRALIDVVANQTGKIFREDVLTIVWSRRFAGYKRANLLLRDFDRFVKLVTDMQQPVQIVWAGKPYPEDYDSIAMFNDIIKRTLPFANCAVLTGYEIGLSRILKRGADVWLNNPRIYREASGTSGMTAAMNGALNFSIPDGWVPEFARHGENCFVIPVAESAGTREEQDDLEAAAMLDMLEQEVRKTYYEYPDRWYRMVGQSMKHILPYFDSNRMAHEYYEKMYLVPEQVARPGRRELVAD